MNLTFTVLVIVKNNVRIYYLGAKFVLKIVGKMFYLSLCRLIIIFLLVTINLNPGEEMRIKNSPILVNRY